MTTPENVGVQKATEAAKAVGACLAIPPIINGKKTDFNDMHQAQGSEAVREAIFAALAAGPVVDDKPESLPPGFVFRDSGSRPGLYHIEPVEDGPDKETWLCSPLNIIGLTRDVRNGAWGLLLEWQDLDGHPHTWSMPKSLLVGEPSSWLPRLVDEGLLVSPATNAKKLLAVFFTSYRTTSRARNVDRTGWHSGIYVLPDETIAPNGTPANDERIVLQTQSAHNPFTVGGTLERWQSTIATWARDNSRLILALCASLAGSLLEAAGQESGGFNFMGQSSTGKTTALIFAASVWGKGSSSGGYVLTWRATDNGLEGLAALHSDAALCLDELSQAPSRTVNEAAYMLANGTGKTRSRQDGSARAAKSWRCMVNSTGEKGLAEKIAEDGGKVQAGQTVRLIDIPADAGAGLGLFENLHGHASPGLFADAIKRAASTHYGHAARAFIQHFQNNREQATTTLLAGLEQGLEQLCPADADGQVRRVAKRFLLAAMAGEMASEWGLLPWGEGEALQAAKVCFDAWLGLRGGTSAHEDTAILSQVRLFIEQHGASRFQDIDRPDATCINRAGFRRSHDAVTIYYVLPESFKEVCKGHNPAKAARVLKDAGLLDTSDKGFKKLSPTLPGMGRVKCYTLNFAIGDNENEIP